MIALCTRHHPQADGGAYTDDDLRKFKRAGQPGGPVAGRFEWLRKNLAIKVGGAWYFNTDVALAVNSEPVVWFTRDAEDRLLLNIRMPEWGGEPRFVMLDSFWMLDGNPVDVECPPSGRLVSVKYPNGDYIRVEFVVVETSKQGGDRFGYWPDQHNAEYPVTVCVVQLRVPAAKIDLGPTTSYIGGAILTHCTFNFSVGFDLKITPPPPPPQRPIPRNLAIPGMTRAGLNGPCLCGSGRKYKACCGRTWP
ncbi:SEC-C domain-containing protein [bacterium]|nr:SEC-C domain-containing protein [bacterium]